MQKGEAHWNRSWIEDEDYCVLAKYATKVVGDMVELGTFRGGTTELLSKSVKPGYYVFTVDRYHVQNLKHFTDYDPVVIYNEFLEKYHNTFLIVSDSAEVANILSRPIALLFIDAAHSYDAVSRDFYAFSKFVAIDGYVALHDYGEEPGVVRLVNELVDSGRWVIVDKAGLMVIIKRVIECPV